MEKPQDFLEGAREAVVLGATGGEHCMAAEGMSRSDPLTLHPLIPQLEPL